MTDAEFIDWIADRLVNIHGESENTSHVQRLRKMAHPEQVHVHNSACCNRIDDHRFGVPHSCNGL